MILVAAIVAGIVAMWIGPGASPWALRVAIAAVLVVVCLLLPALWDTSTRGALREEFVAIILLSFVGRFLLEIAWVILNT